MQLLLGFFFFSVLLATGNSLSCEICTSPSADCSGDKKECDSNFDTCMMMTTELSVGTQKSLTTVKTCGTKDSCKSLEEVKGKTVTSPIAGIPAGAVLKQLVCSKAPPSFASFFPAFLGLLLMKLLF